MREIRIDGNYCLRRDADKPNPPKVHLIGISKRNGRIIGETTEDLILWDASTGRHYADRESGLDLVPMPDMQPWKFNDVPKSTFWLRVINDTVGPRCWLAIFANETGLAIGGNRLLVPFEELATRYEWSPTREDGSWRPCKASNRAAQT